MAKASKDEVEREVRRAEGNLRLASTRLGITRERVHALVNEYSLWAVVNESRVARITMKRAARTTPDLIAKARNILKS